MGEQIFKDTGNGNATLTLEGNHTIEHAGTLRGILHESLTKAQVVELDMANVGPVDITFLQLLVSAHKTAASLGRTLKIAGSLPPSVVQIMDEAGVELPFDASA